jgi:hypothetical protein
MGMGMAGGMGGDAMPASSADYSAEPEDEAADQGATPAE